MQPAMVHGTQAPAVVSSPYPLLSPIPSASLLAQTVHAAGEASHRAQRGSEQRSHVPLPPSSRQPAPHARHGSPAAVQLVQPEPHSVSGVGCTTGRRASHSVHCPDHQVWPCPCTYPWRRPGPWLPLACSGSGPTCRVQLPALGSCTRWKPGGTSSKHDAGGTKHSDGSPSWHAGPAPTAGSTAGISHGSASDAELHRACLRLQLLRAGTAPSHVGSVQGMQRPSRRPNPMSHEAQRPVMLSQMQCWCGHCACGLRR